MSNRPVRHKSHSLVHRLLLCGIVCLAGSVVSTTPEAASAPGDVPGPAPSVAAEGLVYHVEWNPPWFLFFLPPMEAGEATLSLSEGPEFRNRKTIRIIFTARSSGALVKLAGLSINDYFEFTSDAETFCTYSVIKREREGKRMRDIEYFYLPESGRLHLREVDMSTPDHLVIRDRDYEGIPPCVKDLFSALYALRRTQLSAGSSTQVLVGDNHVVKEVQVQVEKKERVSTPAGDFETWRANTVSVIGGLFKGGGQFRMWLTADDRKMPVKFEAKVSFGKVTGTLKEVKH